MTARKHLVIFDFDGVLVASFKFSYTTLKRHDPTLKEATFRTWFNGNVGKVLAQHDTADVAQFFNDYGKGIAQQPMIAGIDTVIKDLAAHYRLVIVSSARTSSIKDFLAVHHLAEYFDTVLGYEINPSKVVKLNNLLTTYNSTASDCVFITDTLGDLREAGEVGIPCVAVTWGYHDEPTLQQGKPAALVHYPKELLAAMPKIFT